VGGDIDLCKCTPWKINIQPENGGLEDDFPFQTVDFLGSMLIFEGVPPNHLLKNMVFHDFQPSILGYPYFGKHPNVLWFFPWKKTI